MTGMAVTVNGLVAAPDLGVTLPHEHLLIDMTVRYRPDDIDDITDTPRAADRWRLVRNPTGYRANLVSDDVDETVRELAHFTASGGRTVVDLSPHGLATRSELLRTVSERSGVHVIAATGTYVDDSIPGWFRSASVEELTERFVQDIMVGDEHGIRRGVIGEIGIEGPTALEVRAVTAAARAQAYTGAPCFWHVMSGILPSSRDAVRSLIDLYELEGGDPAKLVLCHQDASGDDPAYQIEMMRRGLWLAFDNFGFESVFGFEHGFVQNPTDTIRITDVARLVQEGWGGQLLLSQDICYRMMRREWGGWGFAHLLDTLAPRFASAGISDELLRTLMTDNPAKLLAFASPLGT